MGAGLSRWRCVSGKWSAEIAKSRRRYDSISGGEKSLRQIHALIKAAAGAMNGENDGGC